MSENPYTELIVAWQRFVTDAMDAINPVVMPVLKWLQNVLNRLQRWGGQ